MARTKKSETPIADAQSAGAQPSSGAGSKQLWKIFSSGATVLSGILTIKLAQNLWRAATRKEPPSSPEHPEIDVREAIMWALVSGAVAELVKVAVSRKTAQYWVRSTGHLPPNMDPVDKD